MSLSAKKLDLNRPVKLFVPSVITQVQRFGSIKDYHFEALITDYEGRKVTRQDSVAIPSNYFKKTLEVVSIVPGYRRNYDMAVVRAKGSRNKLMYSVPLFMLTQPKGILTKLNMHGGRAW